MINVSRSALVAAAVALVLCPIAQSVDFTFEGELPAELRTETRIGRLAQLLQDTQPPVATATSPPAQDVSWIFPWMGEARQRGCTTIQLITFLRNGTAKSLGIYQVPPLGEHSEWARGNLWYPYIKRDFDDKKAQDPKDPKDFFLFGQEDLSWVIFQGGKPIWVRPPREGEGVPTPYPPFVGYHSEHNVPAVAVCNDIFPSGIGRKTDDAKAALLSVEHKAFLDQVLLRFGKNKPMPAAPGLLQASQGAEDDGWLPGPGFGSGCRSVWFLTPGVDGGLKGAGIYDLFKVTPVHSWGIYIKRDTKPDDGNWVLYLDDAFAWVRFANKRPTHFLKDANLDNGPPPPYPITDVWKPTNPGAAPVIPVCSDMFFQRKPDDDKNL